MPILKGTIYITNREDIIYNTPLDKTKVISLDDDGVLMENDSIVVGTCLLPPIEAKIAEVDGNEAAYDSIYSSHLLDPYQQQFLSAIISFIYKGGSLLFFLPEEGTFTAEKLAFHLYDRYGIHPGIIGHQNPNIANWYYDERCIPLWDNMIYSIDVMTPYEFLYNYPLDAVITNRQIMSKLIEEIRPVGDTTQDKINYILRLHKLIHKNSKVRPAIYSIRRN